MKILLINHCWFADIWRAQGHEVWSCGLLPGVDYMAPLPLVHIQHLIDKSPFNGPPDRIVVLDNSAPLVFTGLEDLDIPTLFYSVDVQHHYDLHRYLYNVFDHTLVAQKDYVAMFTAEGKDVEWMPLWASRPIEPSTEKAHDAVFIGTLDRSLNPGRVRFFEALQQLVPIHCTSGEFWKIFPKSKIVLNQTVKKDLNFRVFEAMMSGSMLLTERNENGLQELFTDKVHCAMYERDNEEDAAEKIRYYLDHPEEIEAIGARGRAEMFDKHLESHRAQFVMERLERLQRKERPDLYMLSFMMNFAMLGRTLEKINRGCASTAYLTAMKYAAWASERGERLDENTVNYLIMAATRFDFYMRSGNGGRLLCEYSERHPELIILTLAAIRALLNAAEQAAAAMKAATFYGKTAEEIFIASDVAISSLMQGMMPDLADIA